MSYQNQTPANGDFRKTFDKLTATEFEVLLEKVQSSYEIWRHKTYAERAVVVAKAAKLMLEQAGAHAQTMTAEMGTSISEARGEVEFSARILSYHARNSERAFGLAKLNPTVSDADKDKRSIGVFLCVRPWNFPYYRLARVAGPHLMAGNTMVVKHAGNVPQCDIAFEKVLNDAGAPICLHTNISMASEGSDGWRPEVT